MTPTGLFKTEITGRHVLLALIAFFGVMLAVNGIFFYYAVKTFNGVETTDAYRKGLDYDRRVSEAGAQAQRGWQGALDYDRRHKRLSLRLKDREGFAVPDLTVTAEIGRPATDRFDRIMPLDHVGPGLYRGAAERLEPGQWIVAVEARRLRNGAPVVVYRMKERLWIKPGS
ncbi:MAG: FixH family protein [Methyloligellaceae bacterium]